jgi:hypothetical protein
MIMGRNQHRYELKLGLRILRLGFVLLLLIPVGVVGELFSPQALWGLISPSVIYLLLLFQLSVDEGSTGSEVFPWEIKFFGGLVWIAVGVGFNIYWDLAGIFHGVPFANFTGQIIGGITIFVLWIGSYAWRFLKWLFLKFVTVGDE